MPNTGVLRMAERKRSAKSGSQPQLRLNKWLNVNKRTKFLVDDLDWSNYREDLNMYKFIQLRNIEPIKFYMTRFNVDIKYIRSVMSCDKLIPFCCSNNCTRIISNNLDHFCSSNCNSI